jgi:hypothetical protein
MGSIVNFSLDLNKIPKSAITKKNGAAYLNLTMSVNDDSRYGNNTSVYIAQSKEERDAKTKRDYIGNGRVIWTDGNIVLAEEEEGGSKNEPTTAKVGGDDDFLAF